MLDILICSLPMLSLDRPPGAPALLKAAAQQAGYSAETADLSLSFFINQCHSNLDQWDQYACAFRPSEIVSIDADRACKAWIKQTIDYINDSGAAVLGLSVFSMAQHRACWRLLHELKHCRPDLKIVLGGFGLIAPANSMSTEPDVQQSDLTKSFHNLVTDYNLCHSVVLGAGLDGLIDFLEKTVRPVQTQKTQYETESVLFNTPTPDYDDYQLDAYIWNEAPALPITGSKGCVRACTFCDIPGQFGRFKYRTGKDIANEMLEIKERYGINTFEFTDSLVNGSLKAFREWMIEVAAYNSTKQPHDRIRWFGQYICRPQKHTPKDIYALMRDSGVMNLVIGVESGSNAVLEAMAKKMTVQDVYDELQQFAAHNIKTHFLMLSGFYNETAERFEETLEFLVHIQKYMASGVIVKLSMGIPLFINDQMALHQQAAELGILIDPYDDLNWTSAHDPSNDFVRRCLNRLVAQKLLDKLGISMCYNSLLNMRTMLQRLEKKEQDLLGQLNESRQSYPTPHH